MKRFSRNSWLILILILLFGGNIFSQPSERDKLLQKISNEINDTGRIRLMIDFGLNYANDDSLAMIYLKKAYDLSVKRNYMYGKVFGQYYEVIDLVRNDRYDDAIYKCKRCIEAIDSMHLVVGAPLRDIRFLFNSAGRQEEKFRYYSEKSFYYKQHGPVENLAMCYHAIAGYYNYLADYDKAIEYYMHSRDIKVSPDPGAYAGESLIIGSMYMEWGNLDKAEEFLRSGMKDLIRLNISSNRFYYNLKLGEIYFKRRDYQQSLHYYFEAKKHITSATEKAIFLVNCASDHLELNSRDSARFYLDNAQKVRQKAKLGIGTSQGNLEIDYAFYKYYKSSVYNKLAVQYLKAALREAQSCKFIPLILKYTNELHSYLIKKGDSLQALRYLVQYNALVDSVNKLNTQARIASFEIEQQQQAKENEIEHLQVQKKEQRNYYLFGGAFLLLIVITVIILILYRRKRDKEQLTSDFKNQLAKAETKALRAQMNPHFIFNSLNSINNFVTDQKHEIASDYLLRFSKLIRLILDNSRSETIPLDKELEALQLYVELESIRFDNHFSYAVNIAENTSTGSIMIPPMLLQPFIENAIWHGLMQKRAKGSITVEISVNSEQIRVKSEELKVKSEELRVKSDQFLKITITDDGIGREKAAELKSKSATHRSHGMKVTAERIDMMNKLNSSGAQVHIIDLKDDQGIALGTRVELIIPI